MPADFRVEDQGTIWMFEPLTERARNFAHNSLGLDPWQWLGNRFGIDQSIGPALVNALGDEGFEVEPASDTR